MAIRAGEMLQALGRSTVQVEAPSEFEFVINSKTAQQIGLTIPPNLSARADRVIK